MEHKLGGGVMEDSLDSGATEDSGRAENGMHTTAKKSVNLKHRGMDLKCAKEEDLFKKSLCQAVKHGGQKTECDFSSMIY